MKLNKKLKIAINGFGRIGRAITKINAQHDYYDLVLINDINPHLDNLAYLFRYDSTYGRFNGKVESNEETLTINGKSAICTAHRRLQDVPWGKYHVDIVIDSSGVASNVVEAKRLVKDGVVSKVVVTHSGNGVDHEVVMGVNDDTLTSQHQVVSNSICDANAIAHVLKWLDDKYGIEGGALTTLHPWLSYQNLVDGPSISQSNPGIVWTDYALGRASVDSLIPKNTTAMSATEQVLPQLQGKILSFSYRIPTNIVASSDITLNLSKNVTEAELQEFLTTQCHNNPYVKINTESLVSLDYEQEEASAILDMQWVKVKGKTVKVVLWYDNEWGYSARVLDLVNKLSTI
ncbi:MAG: glyceraldehyde 3-phosphate dehydrogenase NAD-binding domain-containing protein [Gammaproteobacteria bacterium]|jgi:glyceraldehyde 3-phosphate dehydrogenase